MLVVAVYIDKNEETRAKIRHDLYTELGAFNRFAVSETHGKTVIDIMAAPKGTKIQLRQQIKMILAKY